METTKTNGNKKYNVRDDKAPKYLKITVENDEGKEFKTLIAVPKNFSSGSVGFYAGDKMENPDNPLCRYQVGINITLIGSKPESKK